MTNPLAAVIEDEDDLAVLFAEAVQHAGYEAHIVSDGRQARDWLINRLPSLVILDLHIADVAGADILQFIRSEPRLAGTHVIIASADERTVKLLEDQADLALIKPVTFSQLRDLAARFHPDLVPHGAT